MNVITLDKLVALFPDTEKWVVNDEACIIRMKGVEDISPFLTPFRFNGYMAFFCDRGNFRITLNLKEFTIDDDSLFVNLPGNIICFRENGVTEDDFEGVLVAVSPEYISTLKMDINKMFDKGLLLMDNPSAHLSEEEKRLAADYLRLSQQVLSLSLAYKKESVASLLSSILYLAGGVIKVRFEEQLMRLGHAVPAGSNTYIIFERFINLVVNNYTKERSVSFYAGQLCLSPKYLSAIVKEASGRSAPEWIDSFLMMEARNLLKFSDMSVKEIASALNYPDVCTFHKFFRRKAGCTPLEFKKS